MSTTVFKPSDTHSNLSLSPLNHHFSQHFMSETMPSSNKETNIQLKLTSLLQTTIKIEPLFDLFFGQLQHLLKINHCHYYFKDGDVDIKLGTLATHATNYSLNLQDNCLGNIILSRKQRFTESELIHIENLLSILMYPLRNALSYHDAIQQALSDPLTGLGNRGALEQSIDHHWQMAQRYDQHFCVLILDIDYFKKVNDTYGHAVGDKVLKAVAHTISATTRQTDVAYRYGGEEFVVILNKSELVGASITAERIRKNIARLSISPISENLTSKNTINVTISIGASCSSNCQNSNDLLTEADKVLYYAKQAGRNRVELSKVEKKNRIQRNLQVKTDSYTNSLEH